MYKTSCDLVIQASSHIGSDCKESDLMRDLVSVVVFNTVHFVDANIVVQKSVPYDAIFIKNITNNLKLIITKSINNRNRENIKKQIDFKSFDGFFIGYLASKQYNYECIYKMVGDIFNKDNINAFFGIQSQEYIGILKNLWVDPSIEGELTNISMYIQSILSLQEQAEIVKNRIKDYIKSYLNSYIIWQLIFETIGAKIFISQNPFNIIEAGALMAAKERGLKTWFLPHGLPMKSMFLKSFDFISPLTLDSVWFSFGAVPVLLPWAEIYKSTDSEYKKIDDSFTRNGKLKILFLSQIEGSLIHRLPDLSKCAQRFISLLLFSNQVEEVCIRFRSRNEQNKFSKLFLGNDKVKFCNSQDVPNIFKQVSYYDCLASCSSTGLLYSQATGVPSIQVQTESIRSIWPYSLADKDFIFNMHYDRRDVLSIDRILLRLKEENVNKKVFYRSYLDKSRIDKILKSGWE